MMQSPLERTSGSDVTLQPQTGPPCPGSGSSHWTHTPCAPAGTTVGAGGIGGGAVVISMLCGLSSDFAPPGPTAVTVNLYVLVSSRPVKRQVVSATAAQ